MKPDGFRSETLLPDSGRNVNSCWTRHHILSASVRPPGPHAAVFVVVVFVIVAAAERWSLKAERAMKKPLEVLETNNVLCISHLQLSKPRA